MLPKAFVDNNPTMFLTTGWVMVPQLREFLREREESKSKAQPTMIVSPPDSVSPSGRASHAASSDTVPTRVQMKPDASPRVKREDSEPILDIGSSPILTRVLTDEDGRETIQILDSDDEMDVPGAATHVSPAISEAGDTDGDDELMSSTVFGSDHDMEWDQEDDSEVQNGLGSSDYDIELSSQPDSEYGSEMSEFGSEIEGEELGPSDTDWLDPDVHSDAINEHTRITRQLTVERVEFVSGCPSYWPVPRIPTAYIVDFRAEEYDLDDKKGKPFTADGIIKDKARRVLHSDCWIHLILIF